MLGPILQPQLTEGVREQVALYLQGGKPRTFRTEGTRADTMGQAGVLALEKRHDRVDGPRVIGVGREEKGDGGIDVFLGGGVLLGGLPQPGQKRLGQQARYQHDRQVDLVRGDPARAQEPGQIRGRGIGTVRVHQGRRSKEYGNHRNSSLPFN